MSKKLLIFSKNESSFNFAVETFIKNDTKVPFKRMSKSGKEG